MSRTSAGAWALGGFAPLFAALYPLTQLYQLEEDRARGDRTLAIVLGSRWSLAVSIGAVVIAFACFAKALVLSHDVSRDAPAMLALGVAAAAWLIVLIPWIIRASGLSPAEHKRGMYAALGAWALTDVAVLIAVR